MILKSYKYFVIFIFLNILFSPLYSEEKIDIWKNKETEKQLPEEKIDSLKESKKKIFINPKKNTVNEIKIEDGLIDNHKMTKFLEFMIHLNTILI